MTCLLIRHTELFSLSKISDLQRQLARKEENEEKLLSQLRRTKAVADEGEIQQQRFVRKMEDLKNRLEKESEDKRKLQTELQSIRDQVRNSYLSSLF